MAITADTTDIANGRMGGTVISRAFFLTLIMSLFAVSGHARFTLTPGLDLRQEYNDNIFLEADDAEDDLITVLAPNVSMEWQTARLEASLFASIGMEKYLDNTQEDRIGAEAQQDSRLDALADLYREMFFVRISDSYRRVPIDEGGRGGEANRNVNLTDSNQFQINPYLQFQPMKATRAKLSYTYENIWYEEPGADDAERHVHTADLLRELTAKISLSLAGEYTQYRAKDPAGARVPGEEGAYDYDRESASVGLSYRPTERLRLDGRYGHTWLDYVVLSDSDAQTWSVELAYELSSNYTAGIRYSTDYVVSVEDGPSERDYLQVYLEYEERFGLDVSLFASSRDYVEIDRSTDSYGAELSGDLPFNEKVGLTGLVRYTHFDDSGVEVAVATITGGNGIIVVDVDRFDLFAEEYDRYSTRMSLYYATRLGRVSAGYIFNLNESDFDDADYTNNIIYLEASLKF